MTKTLTLLTTPEILHPLLDTPWILIPLRALFSLLVLLAIVMTITSILLVSGSLVRALRPKHLRRWWNTAPSRLREVSAGSIGLKLDGSQEPPG